MSSYDARAESAETKSLARFDPRGLDKHGRYGTLTVAWASLVFRWIPAGKFWMGHPDDPNRHRVDIARGFWLAATPCTQSLWEAVMVDNPSAFPNDPLNPVERVSFEDVQAFLQHLDSLLPGSGARLPSEAEWEYAARAGTDTAFWWGDEIEANRANCEDSGSPWSGQQTAPVGIFPANPFGLHDTVGNIAELTQDRWHPNHQGAPTDGSAWEEGGTRHRVVRGGSWRTFPEQSTCWFRSGVKPETRIDSIGFRPVLGGIAPAVQLSL